MSEDKIIKTIDELYEKYGVERIFYSDMETEQIIRGMKGILYREMLVWHMMHGPGLERFKYQPLLLAENGIILSEIRQHMRLLRIFLIASLKSMKNMVMVLLKKQKILMI